MSTKIKTDKSKFNDKQFILFSLNWIVGFGFLAALTTVVSSGAWGFLSFVIATFVAWGILLVFTRGLSQFPNNQAGSYGFFKLAFGKWPSFFVGWNQLSVVILLSAPSPLFLISILKLIDDAPEKIIYYQLISLSLFILMNIVGALGLKLSKLAIFFMMFIKWGIILLGFVFVAYLGLSNHMWLDNIKNNTFSEVLITVIIANTMTFIYAYTGIDSLAAVNRDVLHPTKIKKLMYITYAIIFLFYSVSYILFLGISNATNIEGFQGVYNIIWGTAGLIIFLIGQGLHSMSNSVSSAVVYSRLVVAFAEDGYFPKFLTKKSKNGEYSIAIYTILLVIVISMSVFVLLPSYIGISDTFSTILNTGIIIYLVNFLSTFISLLKISAKKLIKIPLWEKIVYIIVSLVLVAILLISLFPPIVGGTWNIDSTWKIVSYSVTIGLGYIIFLYTKIFKK